MMTLAEMKQRTGIIVPVWYPDTLSIDEMERILTPTLVDVGSFVSRDNVLAIVDGSARTLEATKRVQRRLGNFEVMFQEQNTGKGGVVATGIERLLQAASIEFVVVRDHDNDHLMQDSLNLVHLAARMRSDAGHDTVIAIGRRTSVHRHLGFVRGEYEWMINEVACEAARFALAGQGRAMNTQYFAAYEWTPDMQTGFKCYGRRAAELIVEAFREAPRLAPGLEIRRHGAEIPPIIETLLAGGCIGEIVRSAFEQQPLTTYDLAGRAQVKGTVLAWTLRRAGVPLPVARQFLCNAIARRLMSKEEKGFADLRTLANWALERVAGMRGEKFDPIGTISSSDYF